jgi:ubiquinone biosynthesis protein
MLPEGLIPTPLLRNDERLPIEITVRSAPSKFRSLQILAVISGLLARVCWWRITRRYSPEKAGAETRRRLEHLGGMWIKLGQLLSLRVDLFSNEFWSELSQLQDRAQGFSPAVARASVEEQLGGPVENYFSEFDPEPFAAASTAQVHRARLRQNGIEVAVKVQRPDISRSVTRDMELINRAAKLLELLGIAPHLHWNRMRKELQQIMKEEVDYRYEASNLRRMSRSLKRHRVRVPDVFSDLCTKRILVTELLRGVLMSDYIFMSTKDPARLSAWRKENGVEPESVGRRLIYSLLRQIFEDNLYHGDLHPGNIMLLRDSRVALIDLGTVGFTDNQFLGRYHLFVRSVGTLDFAKAADSLLLLSDAVPDECVSWLRAEMIQTLRNWSLRTHVTTLPFQERSISLVATSMVQILAAAKVAPDWSFLRIRRAEHTLDASIIHLAPRTNYTKIARRYFQRYDSRRLEQFVADGPARAAGGAVAAVEMGYYALEKTLFTASVVRHDALAIESSISQSTYFFKVVLTQMIVTLVAIGLAAIICLVHQHPIRAGHALTESLYPHLFDNAPQLDSSTWLWVLAACVYLIVVTWRLRAKFRGKKVTHRGSARVSIE